MRVTSVPNPTISIPSPSLHRGRPSSSSTGLVITVRRRRSSPRLTVRYQALGFNGHDDEHFSKSSIKYWDKRHQNKFFKDRHYLDRTGDSTFPMIIQFLQMGRLF
ncbi:unnamed protein product [Ilex paraguariensis]|uniref:Uncharacterized protein n=1 Tax=Ilex paraguariensis TaxID=185542 RepID=A0ABC8UG47_9AQUA